MEKIRICVENRCEDISHKVRILAISIYLILGNCSILKVYDILNNTKIEDIPQK